MKKKFRYVPHTADVAFVAYGKSIEEAIENAALAMLNVMLDVRKISRIDAKPRSIRISESAANIDSLVWYTLQDILSRVDEKKLNAYGFKVVWLNTAGRKEGISKLVGKLVFKSAKKDFSLLEVKAVTPHNLRVVRSRGNWSIRVLLDV